MKLKNPFFTISIPSLNRIESLKLVIDSILRQTFSDYEVLIVDDHSENNIRDFVKSLKNPKIRFIGNKKREGFKYTYIKCLLDAKGKYVLTLGNDDMLCNVDALMNIYGKLSGRNDIGLAKLSLIYYFKELDKPCFSTRLEKNDVYLKKTDCLKYFHAIEDYSLTHIAGTIYLRELISREDVLDNDLIPFFKILVECALKRGFLFIAKEYVAVAMSISYLPLFFKKEINEESWFYVNYRIYKQYVSENVARKFVIQKMKDRFPFFISHRSHVGSGAMMFLAKEYVAFDKSFKYNLKMYAYLFIALISPRKLFFALRDMRYKNFVNRFTAPDEYYKVLSLVEK